MKIVPVWIFMVLCSCEQFGEATKDGISKRNSVSDTCTIVFRNFPSSFESLDSIYGYHDGTAGPLYNRYEKDIQYFFNCSEIPLNAKLEKAIQIGTGGKWDADAISLFQRNTMDLIKKNPEEALVILNGLSDSEASSFWKFLFDGPHPNDMEIDQSIKFFVEVFGENNKQVKLLRTEVDRLRRDFRNH